MNRQLDRITWRDGQLLASRDIKDDARNSAELRRLHIRYLHKTWGVVEGLDVVTSGTALRVSPGYALDIEGRELLLPDSTLVQPPAGITTSATMYLVITNAPRSCTPVDLATLCPGVRNRVPIEAGSLTWKTVREVRLGLDVLLARVLVTNGAFASAPDTSIQRRAATFAQERRYSDVTRAGQTGWAAPDSKSAFSFTSESDHSLLLLEAKVDTSDAGFVATPSYFARAVGAPPAAAGYITSASAASFTFTLRVTDARALKFDAAAAESSGVTITWFAIELPAAPKYALFQPLKGNLK